MITNGMKAKDFALKNQNDEEVKMSDFPGKKLLLSFHPLAWTSICGDQMKALEMNKQKLDSTNTIALGISVDAVPLKNAWAKELGVKNTTLLSDFWPHGDLAKSCAVFREKNGFSERANIILDENRTVIFSKLYQISQLPDISEILDFLEKYST